MVHTRKASQREEVEEFRKEVVSSEFIQFFSGTTLDHIHSTNDGSDFLGDCGIIRLIHFFFVKVFLLSMIRHENVMLFMGACLEPPNLAVVVRFVYLLFPYEQTSESMKN